MQNRNKEQCLQAALTEKKINYYLFFGGKLSRVLAQDTRATNPPWAWLCGQKGQVWENSPAPSTALQALG